jgi:amino acid transporter
MPLTFLMVGVVILMLLALIVIRSVRKALKETGRGNPFSMVTVKSLRTAGIVSLISFVLGIVFPIAAIFLFKDIPDVQSSTTTFITEGGSLISALIYFLLSGVAKYGNSFAPDEDVFPAPPVAGDYDDTETY